jgi:MYXO-CTERM domain-containing protein
VRLASLLLLAASAARAQVVEPNGLTVPLEVPNSNETTLQDYFASRMPPEPIDALGAASAEPSTFSPRCGFEAELVLSQSSAAAGLAWYNVPADPKQAPSALYPILAETTQPGATLSSSQIRSDPNYQGGLIGFALTKFGGRPIYYSEALRNAECTACSMPGHWKLMLAYPSPLESTTYYLAWEDWEGANESMWPDDGDFNDKVFRLSGVRCGGGGEPCDTGLAGVCAAGLTGCASATMPSACLQLEAASPEVCDGLDNDCDGMVDDDRPCGETASCIRGVCTQNCGGDEFPCPDALKCDEGRCVEAECAGVRCEPGTSCQKGQCVAPCEDVRCPLGQLCRSGVCKDPCAAVSCGAGSVCREGACLEACQCSGCPGGSSCDANSGKCVEQGCAGVSCPAGTACQAGACVDACRDAKCPRGAACVAGQCDESQQVKRTEAPEQPMVELTPARSPGDPVAGSGSASGSNAPAGRPPAAAKQRDPEACSCSSAGAAHAPRGWLWALVLLARRKRG